MTPVLLLDVDGVINAMTKKPNRAVWPLDAWKFGTATAGGTDWPIAWSTTVVDFLNAIDDSGSAEIRWHTTWQHEASNLAALVGLNTFPIAACPEHYERPGRVAARQIIAGRPAWWKYMTAERILTDEQRPLIWLDDDIEYQVSRPYRTQLATMGRVLIVSPDEQTGLTPKHLRTIETFLKADQENHDG